MYCHCDPIAPGDMAAIQRWRAPNRADSAKQADERWHSAQRHGGTAGPQGKRSPNTVKLHSLKATLITLDLIIRELQVLQDLLSLNDLNFDFCHNIMH